MVSLNGTDVNLTVTNPTSSAIVVEKSKAGSARSTMHKVGATEKNRSWTATGWLNTLVEKQFYENLMTLSTLVFIDKDSRSWDVVMLEFAPIENTFNHTKFRISFKEVE